MTTLRSNQYTIENGTKTILITRDECEGTVSFTGIVFVGFNTSGETALRSKTTKTEKAIAKWAKAS